MATADTESAVADDLVFIALVAAGFYIAINFMRRSQGTAAEQQAGGDYFAPAMPPAAPGQSFLDVLVPMQLSPTGAAFIKHQEGFTPVWKKDAGHRVIGYGHDEKPGDNIVAPITESEGETLFWQDVAVAEQAINSAVSVPLSQSQFDALTDLVFDIGGAAFARSTLLRMLNNGNYAGAAGQLNRWIYSQGSVSNALVGRRRAETQLFNS